MAADAPQSPDVDAAAARRAANRFDIRRIIGGLFLLYGVILTVVGIVGSEAAKTKAAGINVNLWTGLGMLVIGVSFLLWMWLRPLHHEEIAEAVEAHEKDEEPAT